MVQFIHQTPHVEMAESVDQEVELVAFLNLILAVLVLLAKVIAAVMRLGQNLLIK